MKIPLLLLAFLTSFANSFAQSKPKPPTKTEIVPLAYQAFWGPVKSGTVPSAQLKATAQMPLVVKDNNMVVYKVVSFRINYMFKGYYKDEQSGEVKSVNDLRVKDFYNQNSLSTDWHESIRDNVKEGDQVLLNKIIFINAAGKKMLAPDIRITIR